MIAKNKTQSFGLAPLVMTESYKLKIAVLEDLVEITEDNYCVRDFLNENTKIKSDKFHCMNLLLFNKSYDTGKGDITANFWYTTPNEKFQNFSESHLRGSAIVIYNYENAKVNPEVTGIFVGGSKENPEFEVKAKTNKESFFFSSLDDAIVYACNNEIEAGK